MKHEYVLYAVTFCSFWNAFNFRIEKNKHNICCFFIVKNIIKFLTCCLARNYLSVRRQLSDYQGEGFTARSHSGQGHVRPWQGQAGVNHHHSNIWSPGGKWDMTCYNCTLKTCFLCCYYLLKDKFGISLILTVVILKHFFNATTYKNNYYVVNVVVYMIVPSTQTLYYQKLILTS